MKESISIYPFAVYAETKVSQKTGNPYDSISVALSGKDKTGQKTTTYFNLLDERDLLVLADICIAGFNKIKQAKFKERFGDNAQAPQKSEQSQTEQPKNEGVQDGWGDSSSIDDNLGGIFG